MDFIVFHGLDRFSRIRSGFHGLDLVFMDFVWFSWIGYGFHGFGLVFGYWTGLQDLDRLEIRFAYIY